MEHYKILLKLGFPIMLGQLGVIVLSFADTIMVGRYGTSELGAAGFVNSLFNLVVIFSTGFSYGLTPVIGGCFGKADSAGAGRTLKNALAVNALVSLSLVLLMSLIYLNLHRFGQPDELLPVMKPYFLALLASLPPVMIFNAFKQFFDGITDTVPPMYMLLGGNLLNIIGNWVLIYGKCGFPELGLLGAGLATLVSRIIMLLGIVVLFFFSSRYRSYADGFRKGTLNAGDARCLFDMGMPVGLQMGMETASFSLTAIMVGWLGTMALAAHQIMLTVGQLGFMIYYGMAAAVAVRTSNFMGVNDISNVRKTASAGFHMILFMAVAVSVLMILIRNHVGYLFTDNVEVASAVAGLVIPFVIYQFGDGMQCNYSNALRGISDVKKVTLYAFIAYFLVSIPAAYVFAFLLDWGLVGIWLSFPLGLTTAGLLFRNRFMKTLDRLK